MISYEICVIVLFAMQFVFKLNNTKDICWEKSLAYITNIMLCYLFLLKTKDPNSIKNGVES